MKDEVHEEGGFFANAKKYYVRVPELDLRRSAVRFLTKRLGYGWSEEGRFNPEVGVKDKEGFWQDLGRPVSILLNFPDAGSMSWSDVAGWPLANGFYEISTAELLYRLPAADGGRVCAESVTLRPDEDGKEYGVVLSNMNEWTTSLRFAERRLGYQRNFDIVETELYTFDFDNEG